MKLSSLLVELRHQSFVDDQADMQVLLYASFTRSTRTWMASTRDNICPGSVLIIELCSVQYGRSVRYRAATLERRSTVACFVGWTLQHSSAQKLEVLLTIPNESGFLCYHH